MVPLLAALAFGSLLAPPAMRTVEPPRSNDVLLNPGMGLYLQYPPLDTTADEWFMQISDIAYWRVGWSELNPQPGVYKFEEYFGPRFEHYVTKLGKRVAFRVMCQNMHSRDKFVTPEWVFAAGVPGVKHVGLYIPEQTNPVFWDPAFLKLQAEFVAALGQYLDGREGLEFVDIGSIGEWGEMHLARWTSQQLEESGYSEAAYIGAYRQMIDAHAAAFPRTSVFLNVGGQKHHTINDYAALRGMHFRQDGLNPAGASYDCGEWLYKPYARARVRCNFEFHSGYSEMKQKNWDVAATIAKGLEAPISYLNTNLFGGAGIRQAPPEARELLTEAARRIGFRFVIARLELPERVRVSAERPARLPLLPVWRNDGVAPCYASYALEWSLLGGDGQAVAIARQYPENPTTQWWPGEEQAAPFLLRLPAGTPAGEYTLAVRMLDPETSRTIRLGLAGADAAGRYPLATVPAEAAEPGPVVLLNEGFEGEAPTWRSSEGITTAVGDGGRTGRALTISGTAKQTWNYTSVRLAEPLVPGGRYRLSGWMLVERLEPPSKRPYLKLGIHRADGGWLTNFSTSTYDLARLGEWQYLEGMADIPMTGAIAELAVEKGDDHTAVSLALRLDDLKVELIESP